MQPASFYTASFSQAELDRQYSPSQWVNRMGPHDAIMQHVEVMSSGTAAAKKELPCELSVPYDTSDRSYTIHYFNPSSIHKDTPIAIWIHGGYWTAGVLEDHGAYMANCVTAMHATLATLQYRLSPPNRIGVVVHSVRAAIAHIAKSKPGRPLYLFGSSAGGHLSAMVLATNWQVDFGLRSAPIKGALLISGIFDLLPIKLSCINKECSLDLTSEEVADNSPFACISGIQAASKAGLEKVVVAVGGAESPEFIRQSREFERALSEADVSSQFLSVENKDHFDVAEDLRNPSYALSLVLRGLMVSAGDSVPEVASEGYMTRCTLLATAAAAAVAAAVVLRYSR